VRRQAALAAGRLGEAAPVAALVRAYQQESAAPVLRALAETLGKVGGAEGLAALAGTSTEEPELARVAAKARLTAERTIARDAPSAIDLDEVPPAPLPISLRCRAGLEQLLADEIAGAGWPVRGVQPGRVDTVLSAPLAGLSAIRLHHGVGFPLAPVVGEPTSAAIQTLTSAEALRILTTFTRGSIRYRLAWAGGGHRRAAVWRIAREVAAHRPELVNDPTRSTWQVLVHESNGEISLELEPRRMVDPRFAYRVADVPAASHPTVAAALARLAVAHSRAPAADTVWDPFVGSGLELIERARLAPVRRLLGSDLDPSALEAARANLGAAGVNADLTVADALTSAPTGVTCILTNPPMGRRVQRGQAESITLDFLDRAATLLPPGGILVWISPAPGKSRTRAEQAGLRLEDARTVDMGGFAAQLQVLRRLPPPPERNSG
jgi:hypothetical protein